MRKTVELGTVIFIVIVTIVLSCFGMYMYLTSLMPSLVATGVQYDRIVQADKAISKHYIGEINNDEAVDSLILGLVSGVDKYGTFFNEESYSKYIAEMNGKRSDIGIAVRYISSTGLIKVIDVKSNSPAANANVKVGDVIYKVNDTVLSDVSYDDALSLFKGNDGTQLNIVLRRNEKEIEKTITIAEYVSTTVESYIIYDNVGYISISEFNNTTYDDFKSSVEKLQKNGATQFIFDVRNNTGGSLTAVVDILDFILPEGELVSLTDKSGNKKTYSSDKNFLNKPYVVLINGSTYSGGELFAAAIRDYKTGTLVGETTYGKGYAQELIPLKKGALYLSTKIYYPPCGENYEGVGVSPNIVVSLTPDLEDRFYELKTEEDLQIVAALIHLGKSITMSN